MENFSKWLEQTHPEFLEEGWKDWAAAGAMALGSLGGNANYSHAADQPTTAVASAPKSNLIVISQQEDKSKIPVTIKVTKNENSIREAGDKLDTIVSNINAQMKASKFVKGGGTYKIITTDSKNTTEIKRWMSGNTEKTNIWKATTLNGTTEVTNVNVHIKLMKNGEIINPNDIDPNEFTPAK